MERYFPEHRVWYISLLGGIDTGVDSMANDITPFRAIMNDMYAKDISKKIKRVKRDKQRKGPFITGLWSSERISEMLRSETYIGNLVQGHSVKVSYKSKKCLKQSPENWVVVEGTHEPIIDKETF